MFRVSSVIKLTRIFISEGFIPFVSNKYVYEVYVRKLYNIVLTKYVLEKRKEKVA